MLFCKILWDLKLAAVRLYQGNHMPLDDILDCLKISESTFYRVLSLWNTTGDVVRHTFGIRGRPRVLHFNDVDYLKRLVKARPDWFLDRLLSLLETYRFILTHYTTIHCELIHANVSTKKLKIIAAERNENLWSDFIWRMAQYEPEQLGFLDEVLEDERTSCRRREWFRKGTRAVKKGVFICGCCFLLKDYLQLMGWSQTLLSRVLWLMCIFFNIWNLKWCYIVISPLSCAYNGLTCFWFELPLSSPFPGVFSVFVMDNAQIHHGEGILELAELYGRFVEIYSMIGAHFYFIDVWIEFLPPYSPDLNLIEEAFSKIKPSSVVIEPSWYMKEMECCLIWWKSWTLWQLQMPLVTFYMLGISEWTGWIEASCNDRNE